MAPLLVFDTATLWNFASINRLDVLETRYGARCHWTESVQLEVLNSEPWEPALRELRNSGSWLGEPIAFETSDLAKIMDIQRILAAPSDPPTKHVGESECIYALETRLQGAWLVTDDRAAADLARRRGHYVIGTTDVLQECYVMGELRCPEPYDLLVEMAGAGRDNVSVPSTHAAIC